MKKIINCENPLSGFSFRQVVDYLKKVVADDGYDFDWDGTFSSRYGSSLTSVFVDKAGIDTAVDILEEIVQYKNLYDVSRNRDCGMDGFCIVFKMYKPGYADRLYCKIFIPDGNLAYSDQIVVDLHD